ncbi:hypothetical protein ABT072_47440 [Streptomyces sp. NPDC002589]|uniref:hypothetical protein n=1 Tax=Streptomyces sp. NPDC002589 TaxID=3154420 RepID=UPI00331A8624
MIEEPRKTSDSRLVACEFDGIVALDWIRGAAGVTGTLATWDQGGLAEAAVGKSWDVVRLPRALGWQTVTQMRLYGTPIGSVQHTPDGIEVLAPVGSAAGWHLPDADLLHEAYPAAIAATHMDAVR